MGEEKQSMIIFTSHEIDFTIKNEPSVHRWLMDTSRALNKKIGSLNYYFCDDKAIREINQSYLSHDYATDIITFPYEYDPIEAEIYISIETVESNAQRYEVSFDQELLRVIVHGLLHMLGYDDQNEELQSEMSDAENKFLNIFNEES